MKPVPLLVAMKRTFMLFMLSLAFFIVSAFIMLGEDVYWKIAFVDLLYSNIGTNPGDAWVFVALMGIMVIWGVGLFWVVGALDSFLSD